MPRVPRTLAALSLLSFLLACMPALPAFGATGAAHASGCHHHSIPAPTPVGHQCCQGSNQAASPTASFSFRFFLITRELQISHESRPCFFTGAAAIEPPLDAPPRLISLRI